MTEQIIKGYDKETEVLTNSGFKFFKDINEDDLLATVNPEDSKIIYEKPIQLLNNYYKGEMYKLKHQSLDALITPNQKILLRKWIEAKRTLSNTYELIESQRIGWYVGLMNSVIFEGSKEYLYILPEIEHHVKNKGFTKNIDMKLWLNLLGIFIAEGTLLKIYIKKQYGIQIAGFKEREKSFIRNLLTNLNINYCERIDRFTFLDKQIYEEICSYGLKGVKAPFKFVPEFIFKLSPDLIKEFLLGYFMGDGSKHGGARSYTTSSIQLANDVQLLHLLIGKWANIYIRAPRESIIRGRKIKGKFNEHTINEWENQSLSILRKRDVSKEKYEGMIYNVEVPTYHTLITKRNGKILISGDFS